jgi:hypothetical protein
MQKRERTIPDVPIPEPSMTMAGIFPASEAPTAMAMPSS